MHESFALTERALLSNATPAVGAVAAEVACALEFASVMITSSLLLLLLLLWLPVLSLLSAGFELEAAAPAVAGVIVSEDSEVTSGTDEAEFEFEFGFELEDEDDDDDEDELSAAAVAEAAADSVDVRKLRPTASKSANVTPSLRITGA